MLTEFVLDDRAIDYIYSELSKGRGLARQLAQLPLRGGRVVTYLPDTVTETALMDFGSGGVASGEENRNLAQFIQRHLKETTAGPQLCVLEHALARRGDPVIARWEIPYFTVGDEVYLFAEGGSSFDQVLGILTEGHLYPAIGTLASLPDGYRPIDEGAAVDQDVLRRLAEGTRYLIVGAYDAEGWLIWSHR